MPPSRMCATPRMAAPSVTGASRSPFVSKTTFETTKSEPLGQSFCRSSCLKCPSQFVSAQISPRRTGSPVSPQAAGARPHAKDPA